MIQWRHTFTPADTHIAVIISVLWTPKWPRDGTVLVEDCVENVASWRFRDARTSFNDLQMCTPPIAKQLNHKTVTNADPAINSPQMCTAQQFDLGVARNKDIRENPILLCAHISVACNRSESLISHKNEMRRRREIGNWMREDCNKS